MSSPLNFLKSATTNDWLDQVLDHLDLLLLDHSHCERKAAGVALAFMARYPSSTQLIYELTQIAQEELSHFAQVNQWLEQRGVALQPLSPSPYGAGLKTKVRPREPERMLDSLLVAALIEARSHERMQLLAHHCPEADLARFYHSLIESEARHYGIYWQLARLYFPHEVVSQRLNDLAWEEAALLSTLHPEPRMHS